MTDDAAVRVLLLAVIAERHYLSDRDEELTRHRFILNGLVRDELVEHRAAYCVGSELGVVRVPEQWRLTKKGAAVVLGALEEVRR